MILPPDLIARLRGDGFSTEWLTEHTTLTRAQCVRVLRSIGATQSGGRWTMPSIERTKRRERWLSGGHAGTMKDGDLPWSKT